MTATRRNADEAVRAAIVEISSWGSREAETDPTSHVGVHPHVPRREPRRLLLTLAAGLALLATAAIALTFRTNSAPASLVPATPESHFPPTQGAHAPPFQFRITSVGRLPTVEITSIDEHQVCVRVVNASETLTRCFGADTIAMGWAYGIAGAAGGSRLVFGVVPDEIDTVLLGDEPALLVGNVWAIEVASTQALPLVVGDSVEERWSHPVILEAQEPAPTTTVAT